MTKILMVVSSNTTLGEGGGPTGVWLEELAAAYYIFRDAGCSVTIASPSGGVPSFDSLSLEPPWLTDYGKRFQNDPEASAALECTALDEVVAKSFDAIYLVGGVATAWDFLDNKPLANIIRQLYELGRPVAGVCHGVLGLTEAVTSSGEPILKGKSVTGISNTEEKMTGFDAVVPVLPENRLVELGAHYTCAEPLQSHVVSDGNIFTGQNPASAGPLAALLLQYFNSA